MCGRYALALFASHVRRQIEQSNMPMHDWPDDAETRPTYNFAPGYYGLVYREDVPDLGASHYTSGTNDEQSTTNAEDKESENQDRNEGDNERNDDMAAHTTTRKNNYKLQSMKWGLIPFWTKRTPDYGSMTKTINCRDDSLATKGGMWQTMKEKKRCIVICQGFFEWLKKNDGKDKLPHFVKRADGQLMCFAGLWDCVTYEGTNEKLYTYTIITTESNKQLNFLHDRMPVIFNNGSDEMFKWLDSGRAKWSQELQSLLKPFEGELECYPVIKDVGKVGNDSPTFIVPLDSSENKQNITNFFNKEKKKAPPLDKKHEAVKEQSDVARLGTAIEHISEEARATQSDVKDDGENNAPKPIPTLHSLKRDADQMQPIKEEPVAKSMRFGGQGLSPKKTRSATSNGSAKVQKSSSSPSKPEKGSQKITSFFKT